MGANRTARVLHISRDDGLRLAIARGLERVGHEVTGARDAVSGLAELTRDSADVVLLDLVLPEMDGTEVCRRLKRVDPSIGVIFLTDQRDVVEKVRALEAGGDDYCVTPIDVDELDARIGVLVRKRDFTRRLEQETRKFRRFAHVDPLTDLANRRAFDEGLKRAWARACRAKRTLALLLLDIDQFKSWNDHYGHRAGDAILARVGGALAESVRRSDEAFRLGGDEFAVLAPDTDLCGATILADRLRSAVAEVPLGSIAGLAEPTLRLSVSIGHAIGPDVLVKDPDFLVELADRALYDAKGRRDRAKTDHSGVRQLQSG